MKAMSFLQRSLSLRSRKWLIEPVDLESGRRWLADILLILMFFLFPLSLFVSVPVFLREKQFSLVFIDALLTLTIFLMVIFRNMTLKIRGYIALILVFLLSTSFIITLGPHYARPAWLVMSAVFAALFFNVRTAVFFVSLNAVMLMLVYWSVGVENKAWASTLAAPLSYWIMFVVNVSIISLVSSFPLSFLLKRLDSALRQQQEDQKKIEQHTEKVESAYCRLQKETEERRRAEESLKKSDELLSKLIDAVPDIVVRMDMEGKISFINEKGAELAGYSTTEELIGVSMLSLVAPEDMPRILENTRRMLDHPLGPQEYDFITKEGRRISLEVNGDLLRTSDGTPYGMVHVCRDITERKQAEEALKASEERYRNILQNIDEGYYEVDIAGNLTFFNDSLCSMLGYSRDEMQGMNNRKYTDEENAKKLYTVFNQVYMTGAPAKNFDWIGIRKDGTKRFGEISVSPIRDRGGEIIGFRGIARDITKRRRAEEEREKLMTQLQQAQKMEAIGTLAGGIAHDFNNILTAIIGNAELALINITDKNPLHPYLMQVQESSRRAADLVRQILTFSRQKGEEPELIQPSSIVKETLKMLRSTLPSMVEIQQHIENDPGLILADPTQIHQILMNLCTNAAHAMRENGGLLEVLMDHINLTAEEVLHYSGLNPGPYLRLSVRDTGQGMTPEVMEHIFDPYFTTKKVGEGTGLGLAVVYGIVKKSNGDIKVYSEPGEGSLFEILLPRLEWVEDAPPPKESETIPEGKERILLVDDEKDLINIFQKMLSGLGYRVTSTLNSIDALEIFKARPEEFDAVITDMTMPQQTGTELARRIKQIRADIPIILSTGYSDLVDEQKAREVGIQAFLMKPVGREMLSKTLRRLLDEKRRVDEEFIGTRH